MKTSPCLALVTLLTLAGCGKLDGFQAVGQSGLVQGSEAGDQGVADSHAKEQDAHASATASGVSGGGDETSTGASNATGEMRASLGTMGPTSNHVAGSRLQSRVMVTNGGHRSWGGWYDSERDEDCEFRRDAQGVLRCLPVTAPQEIQFLDAGCSQAAVAVESSCVEGVTPRYAFRSEPTVCGAGVAIFSVGLPVVPEVAYSINDAGECVAIQPDNRAYYMLAGEVAPDAFVAAEYGAVDGPSRIKSYGILADDGAIQVTGFVDSALDLECRWDGDVSAACVPTAQAINHYADLQRTHPLLVEKAGSCEQAGVPVGVRLNPATCWSTYYKARARYEGDTVYDGAGRVVADMSAAPSDEVYHEVGDRMVRENFAAAKRQRDLAPPTRLAPVYWTTEDGGTWFSHWYDRVLQTDCSFFEGVNGESHCIPRRAGNRVIYADAACSDAITEAPRTDACGLQIDPPAFVNELSQNSCGSELLGVRRVLSPRELTTVYEKTGDGSCASRPAQETKQYFELSTRLPAYDLVKGTTPTNG